MPSQVIKTLSKDQGYGSDRLTIPFRLSTGFILAPLDKEEFKPDRMTIIGISPDPIQKQGEFVKKQNLNVSTSRKKCLQEYHTSTASVSDTQR
jgi:hypothetical protein